VPIYEYRCESCEHKLEKLQRMSDGDLVDCPECEQPALKRLVSAAAFRLKGSGWYETDFKKDNKRNLAESPSTSNSDKSSTDGAGKKADKSSSDSSANKPAAKSATKESKHA
jgi:putative FmdB family regulatory protein